MPYRTETRYNYTKRIVPVTKYKSESYWDWGSFSFKTRQVPYTVYEEQVTKEPYTVQVWYDEPKTSSGGGTTTGGGGSSSSGGKSSSGSGGTSSGSISQSSPAPVISPLNPMTPLEQAIFKTNPDFAKQLYEKRTNTESQQKVSGGSTGTVVEKGITTTPTKTQATPFIPMTPLEQVINKANPDFAKQLYEKRTGTTIPAQTIDLKKILAQDTPVGSYQRTPGGPVEIMSVEENARINAQRDIPGTLAYEHGITINDNDYGNEISRLTADISSGQGSVQSEKKWVQDYQTFEQGINQNIATIRAGPKDAQWEIDLNNDKKIDTNEVFTSQQAIDYFQGELSTAQDTKRKVEENIPLLESDIRSMRESKTYLEEYQRKGYYFDIKDGEYSFSEPKASEVVEKIYGNRPDLYIASELRTLGFGVLFAGGQDLISGGGTKSLEANKEATAESILGATRKPGESIEGHAVRFWTSPEAIADVWVPLATVGLSKGITMAGRIVAPKVIGIGSRLAGEVGSTGTRIISGAKTVATGAGKILSQPTIQYGMKYGMYGALEAPTLIDVATNRPEMLGSTLGKSLFRWETAWGAMDVGLSGKPIIKSSKVEESVFVGQPVTENVFMRDVQKKIETSGPQVFIGEEQKLAEFGIKPKYTILEKGQQGPAELKLNKFTGFDESSNTTFTGYILTSDKPVVIETGTYNQRWWGQAKTADLHPSLTSGEEIFVSDKRSLVFGTSSTKVETKGLLTKKEKTMFSEFKGISEEPMETTYHYRTPRLNEPGITTENYISNLTVTPRSGKAITITGLGESRQGYQTAISSMNKNKLIVSEGTRTDTEFIGKLSTRNEQQYEEQFIKEYGNVYSKTKTGESTFETGISGGDISLTKPTQGNLIQKVEGVEIKISRGLSGGTSAFKLISEQQAEKSIISTSKPSGATAGGMTISNIVEEETNEYVRSPYTKTQGLTNETEYISEQWNETRPTQGTRNLTLTGVSLVTLTGKGDLTIDDRDQFTGDISGTGLKPDTSFTEKNIPDFGMRSFQDTGVNLRQTNRQDQLSLSRSSQASELISSNLTQHKPTPTTTPRGIHIRIPRIGKGKTEEEEKRYYKPVKKQKQLLQKNKRAISKGLRADLLSVTQSQARYGKATQPRLTKQIWSEGEKTLFKRVPTEELIKGGKTKTDNLIGKNKGGKKNVYY